MREFGTCAGVCREERVELVTAAEYDSLVAMSKEQAGRLSSWLALVEQIATAPRSETAYAALRERARREPHRLGPDPAWEPTRNEPTVVWRCPDCGGLEAPQPCIDVCIWGPAEWVDASAFEGEYTRAVREHELERTLASLVRRFASVAPRDHRWEPNLDAFCAQAERLLAAGKLVESSQAEMAD
jgi:hypothetical protein